VNASAWFAAHKIPVLAGGAGGVALLALARRHAAGSSSGTVPTQAVADTSASDLYNTLQPELEQLTTAISAASAWNALPASGGLPGGSGTTPPPAPTPAPAAQPVTTPGPSLSLVAEGNPLHLPVPSPTYSPSPLDYAVALGFATQDSSSGSTIVTGPANLGTGPIVDAAHEIEGERYVALPGGRFQVIE